MCKWFVVLSDSSVYVCTAKVVVIFKDLLMHYIGQRACDIAMRDMSM